MDSASNLMFFSLLNFVYKSQNSLLYCFNLLFGASVTQDHLGEYHASDVLIKFAIPRQSASVSLDIKVYILYI